MSRGMLLLILLLVGNNLSETELDPLETFQNENSCSEIKRWNYHQTSHFFTEIFDTVTKLFKIPYVVKDFDLQKSNFFEVIHQPPNFSPFSSFLTAGYLTFMSHDQDDNFYNNFDESYAYIYNEDRTGSVEEYVVYMLDVFKKYVESEAASGCKEQNSPTIIKDLMQTVDLGPDSYKNAVEHLMYPVTSWEVQTWMTYDSRPEWNDWATDKLATVVKNQAFFGKYRAYSSKKAKEYLNLGLQGGKDPLTFILERPKVLQSPKMKPILRMAMTRFVAETENFDKEFLRFVTCFISYYSFVPVKLIGWNHQDIPRFLNQLKRNYEESLTPLAQPGQKRDPEVWIEFMDAMLVQLERIDFDQIFYDLYAILYKTKLFLGRLDFDQSMVPNINKLISSIQQPIILLSCGKGLTIKREFNNCLEKIKGPRKEKLWKSLNEVYRKTMTYFDKEFILPSANAIRHETDIRSLNIKFDFRLSSWGDLFRVEYVDYVKRSQPYFEVTRFLRNYEKLHSSSIFQPTFEFLDGKYLTKLLVKFIRTTAVQMGTELKPIFTSLFQDIELTPVDYGLLKESYNRFITSATELMDRVENTQ